MKEGPFFIKIDEFKNIVEILNGIKGKINEAYQSLDKIYELKSKEESALDQWKQQLEEVERKTNFIDKVLFDQEA